MNFDVLVIGAGPAGATTALLLAKAGWSVAIVEKKVFPRRKVCGEFISATSLPLLQKLGIDDFYTTHSGPAIKRVGLFVAEKSVIADMPSTENSEGKWGRALGRDQFDAELLKAAVAHGAQCWQPAEISNLQYAAKSVACTVVFSGREEQLTANLLVLAHGSWEKGVIETKHLPHKPTDLLAFKAHFKNSQLASDLMPLIAFPGGYGGLVNTDNNRLTLSCCIRRDVLQQIRQRYVQASAGDAVLQHILHTCKGASEVLKTAERDGTWLAAGPIRPGIRRCYKKNIFYVGNLAGEAHPVVAEGISMSMQSAWLLTKALLKYKKAVLAGNPQRAGREYQKSWRRHFAPRIYMAALYAHVVMRPRLVKLFLPIFDFFPSLLSLASKLSGKIKQVVPSST